jgi:tRNA-Thr(GGU) m(6)t(6)A37 methyltransferase TsaA
VPSEPLFTLTPIGSVESALTDLSAAPKQGTEGAPAAWLVFEPAFQGGLRDLQIGDEVLAVTWLDRADQDVLQVHPRDDLTQPLRGVFSTRSADRPNPIGIHRVQIVSQIDTLRFQVQPLEALDKTPIIDIKPVIDRRAEI